MCGLLPEWTSRPETSKRKKDPPTASHTLCSCQLPPHRHRAGFIGVRRAPKFLASPSHREKGWECNNTYQTSKWKRGFSLHADVTQGKGTASVEGPRPVFLPLTLRHQPNGSQLSVLRSVFRPPGLLSAKPLPGINLEVPGALHQHWTPSTTPESVRRRDPQWGDRFCCSRHWNARSREGSVHFPLDAEGDGHGCWDSPGPNCPH